MNKKEKAAKIIISVLLFLTVAFIWGHSCMPPAASTEESDFVKEIIDTVVQSVSGNQTFSMPEVVIRKSAHFFEYAVLGLEFAIFILLFAKAPVSENKKEPVNTDSSLKKASPGKIPAKFIPVLPFICSLFIASIDETIQYFSGRYSSVFDVCLDFTGSTVAILIFMIIRHSKRK